MATKRPSRKGLPKYIAAEFDRIETEMAANNPSMERLQVIEETLSELEDAGLIITAKIVRVTDE